MPEISIVPGESLSHRAGRGLVGWLSEEEAVIHLLGGRPAGEQEARAAKEVAKRCREAVAQRPIYVPADPTVESPYGAHLEAVATRQDVRASFASNQWRPAAVDIRKVLSFQKIVFADGMEDRVGNAARDLDALFELCLPAHQLPPPTGAMRDADGKGYIISALNPNLRIAGSLVQPTDVSPAEGLPAVRMQAITFLVHIGTSYVQVAEYRGRYFVRDGYHRVAALLRAGVTTIPFILITARSFDEVSPPGLFFPYEILYGERPPAVADFWDQAVSHDVEQVAVRKVVRIRGDEFAIAR